jgi:hypothetical protein
MIKKICGLILLAALSAACGSGELEDEDTLCDMSVQDGDATGCANGSELDELGELEQPIYIPSGYGHAGSNACTSVLDCFVPDKKYIQAKFYASTCSSWWQARMVTAFANIESMVDNLGDDWGFIGPGSGLYEVRCGNALELGSFTPLDTQVHSGGPIQYNKGNILVDVADIQNLPFWVAGSTETQRQTFAVNAIRHEFGHLLGLPHGSGIMHAGPETIWWNSVISFSAAQRTAMQCYNEDSTTTPDCP